MKKYYVRASEEDITKEDIHNAAVQIISDELDYFYDNWSSTPAYAGWNIFKKLGLSEKENGQGKISYSELLNNNGDSDFLTDLDTEIFDILGDIYNNLE